MKLTTNKMLSFVGSVKYPASGRERIVTDDLAKVYLDGVLVSVGYVHEFKCRPGASVEVKQRKDAEGAYEVAPVRIREASGEILTSADRLPSSAFDQTRVDILADRQKRLAKAHKAMVEHYDEKVRRKEMTKKEAEDAKAESEYEREMRLRERINKRLAQEAVDTGEEAPADAE